MATMMPPPTDKQVTVHRPRQGGLFDTSALCGETAVSGDVLVMHVWDYNCRDCAVLSGERVTDK